MKLMRISILVLVAACVLFSVGRLTRVSGVEELPRANAEKLMRDGNWKEAYEGYAKLALDPKSDPQQVGNDLKQAIACLVRLNRTDEVDELREKVVTIHAENWRLLAAAAHSYAHEQHYGYIVAGKFYRGSHRGGGRYVSSIERDRVRAMQLMMQAVPLADDTNRAEVGAFYLQLAEILMRSRNYYEAWRLQDLTALETLPDYEEGYYGRGNTGRGAPVLEDGTPVFYYVPAEWASAKNDGERWRWALQQAMQVEPSLTAQVQYEFATFLHNQFGVQTMAGFGVRYSDPEDDTRQDESGPYAVQTLADNETIARLANGIKRFTLPDEFNYIKIFQRLANGSKAYSHESQCMLGQIYENRRQYAKAADYWQRAGEKDRVKQIRGNWGRFESVGTQSGGREATVEFRYRNAKQVTFVARKINVEKLLQDVEAFVKSRPKQLDWEKMNIDDIGYRLVTKNQQEYLGGTAAKWTTKLQPRPGHFDTRASIITPLRKAGAYLLTATLKDGNTSNVVIWIADLAIVKKPLEDSVLYYVADAVTGEPVAKANVEFFGYRQQWVSDQKQGSSSYNITTRNFAEYTDTNGQIILTKKEMPEEHSWIAIARSKDRLAYLGFTGNWFGRRYDHDYNEEKTFLITDRPVYRPDQSVKFKLWLNTAKYDQEGKSPFAGKSFTVRINNPRGEKVYEKSLTTDDFGGIAGEYALPKDAPLGQYGINLDSEPYGGGSFRVEEYKKPEFEVNVDAPTEPVMLGETISATIKAKYYFGAPVTDAKVKYKILRTPHSATWYPVGDWDWFYGPGYWWFAYDSTWFPGWNDWGCRRPIPIWWGWRPAPQPEVVAEAEVPIGPEGTVKVSIDTALAKAMHADTDHRYEITAEVTDQSRRTIVGQGTVLVARKPFKVYAWVNRGHYRVGDVIHAYFNAHTLDNQPVQGKGVLRLLRITYRKAGRDLKPVETEVQRWTLDTNDQGKAYEQLKASAGGQYRLSYQVTDAKGHTIEGGYLFTIIGQGFDSNRYRFNEIELITDSREYRPGDTVKLMIATNRPDATVLLFVRPTNGVYLPPKVLRLEGKVTVQEIPVTRKDMPNFFVEALTVSDGKVYSEMREIVVPPEKRVLNVDVTPSATEYKPGEKASVTVKLTDAHGKPFQGSTVVSLYDKSVEYISGGSNVPDIKEFFWKWRRNHHPQSEHSLMKSGRNLPKPNEEEMRFLGVFGHSVPDEESDGGRMRSIVKSARGEMLEFAAKPSSPAPIRMDAQSPMAVDSVAFADSRMQNQSAGANGGQAVVQPTIRANFADTALWVAALTTNANGEATVDLTMPENLTTWKAKVWAMGDGAAVGEGSTEVITRKNLMVRLQAPRFFTQKDEVVISVNVHNYLKTAKQVEAVLEVDEKDGAYVNSLDAKIERRRKDGWGLNKAVTVAANGEQRVDWRIRVEQPGQIVLRVKALTDEESDAMQMTFPVYVHGMLKMESFSGVIRPGQQNSTVTINVPAERRPEQTRLEVRYSPTLAGAMVDALPYLVDYPYETTESTLNRFLPTVITQNVLLRMGLNLKKIQEKRTNLNAQEIGDDTARAQDWRRMGMPFGEERNPVFDDAEVRAMVKANIERLTSMQCSDGGWGWFSGWGERSYPHTTALVVHGLQIARANDVALVPGVLERGVEWLKNYQAEQVRLLKLWDKTQREGKSSADAVDAFVYMVLVDEKIDNKEMRDYLYRDRNNLPVYAKSMFGLALHRVGDIAKRDMLIRNIDQYLVQDDENQTAYLKLPQNNWWWCWYGSEYEAQAYYLKLLCVTEPKGEKASRLVKYLINNRKHATYWNSTRDTAVVIEAFADYLKASGEEAPNMTVQVRMDGKTVKEVKIDKSNLFSFDNKFVLEGDAVTTGTHTIELVRIGDGPLYFNAYLTNFTLEDHITKAGLEIKVDRKYYKLVRVNATTTVEGAHGQSVRQQVEKYRRVPLEDLSTLKSGDLVEVELEIDSKNDYEYLLFEDMKAAGFEPMDVRSGYGNNDMGAYMELRDDRVSFFVRTLARGKHSLRYRLRAEIPGLFSALPTKASAMYAPELKANSDELKLNIED